jgi:hypothetical protein
VQEVAQRVSKETRHNFRCVSFASFSIILASSDRSLTPFFLATPTPTHHPLPSSWPPAPCKPTRRSAARQFLERGERHERGGTRRTHLPYFERHERGWDPPLPSRTKRTRMGPTTAVSNDTNVDRIRSRLERHEYGRKRPLCRMTRTWRGPTTQVSNDTNAKKTHRRRHRDGGGTNPPPPSRKIEGRRKSSPACRTTQLRREPNINQHEGIGAEPGGSARLFLSC